jgi:hypothetical protein
MLYQLIVRVAKTIKVHGTYASKCPDHYFVDTGSKEVMVNFYLLAFTRCEYNHINFPDIFLIFLTK